MLKGFDFSFGSGLTVAEAKKLGYQFVCRYLSGGNSKDITKAELDNWVAGGVPVVFVWEVAGQMTGAALGTAHARAAQAELNSLGASSAVVFFAQDIPVQVSAADQLAYLRATEGVLGHDRNGGYGDFASIHSWFDAGVIKYGWQTYGGSGTPTVWDDRADIRQVLNDIHVGPAQADEDQAAFWASKTVLNLSSDFGQWPRPKATPPPSKGPYRHVVPAGNTESLWRVAVKRGLKDASSLISLSLANLDSANAAAMNAYVAYDNASVAAKHPHVPMGEGFVYYTENP